MTIAQMREYIKAKYTKIYSRGGAKIPVDKAPDAQIVALYHSMKNREYAKALKDNVKHTVNKDKQYEFNF